MTKYWKIYTEDNVPKESSGDIFVSEETFDGIDEIITIPKRNKTMKICPQCANEKEKEISDPYTPDYCYYCGKRGITATVKNEVLETFKDIFPGFDKN